MKFELFQFLIFLVGYTKLILTLKENNKVEDHLCDMCKKRRDGHS
ncbi:hypothetical protein MHB78_14680 [Bacillus sp. FSL K6-0138]